MNSRSARKHSQLRPGTEAVLLDPAALGTANGPASAACSSAAERRPMVMPLGGWQGLGRRIEPS